MIMWKIINRALFGIILFAGVAYAQPGPPPILSVGTTQVVNGTINQCLTIGANNRLNATPCAAVPVTTFSAGTTGLTPSSPTTGAIVLGGTLAGVNGGTGVANSGKSITLGGNFTTTGAFDSTFAMSGTGTYTFPIAGSSLAPLLSPSFTTPSLGVATATSINGVAITTSLFRTFLSGCTLSNDGGTPNTKLDMAACVAADSTNATLMTAGAFTKTTGGAWASGTGNNGMGNGLTIAINTWYHVCLANNSGTPDYWFDTSVSCANRPAGIADTKFRRVGSFKTATGTTNILTFNQNGNEFIWVNTIADFTTAALSSTASSKTLTVPTGLQVWAKFRAIGSDTVQNAALFYPLDQATQVAVLASGNVSLSWVANSNDGGDFMVRTNTSAQIGVVSTVNSGTLGISTYGWVDYRGQNQ